jgi:hypothetical protein
LLQRLLPRGKTESLSLAHTNLAAPVLQKAFQALVKDRNRAALSEVEGTDKALVSHVHSPSTEQRNEIENQIQETRKRRVRLEK